MTRARGEQIRECTVWDESDTGMRLVVDAPDENPDILYVYPTLDSSSRRHCRVIWRAGEQKSASKDAGAVAQPLISKRSTRR